MWRIIDISNPGYFIHVKRNNVFIEKDGMSSITLPFSEIHSIILSSKDNTVTAAFLSECINSSIPVIFCNEKYFPTGMLLPFYQHGDNYQRINNQINASEPRKKKAWQLIIKAKLNNSAKLLEDYGYEECSTLKYLSQHVLSGDSTNCEAQGARIYFNSLFGDDFKRGNDEDSTNIFLNYGYTVIRAMVARAVVARGLNPTFGVFHSPKINPYCLVDDLMEPYRPLVDRKVKQILSQNPNLKIELTPITKKQLSSLILSKVFFEEQLTELSTATFSYVLSYYNFLRGENNKISFPHFSKELWQ